MNNYYIVVHVRDFGDYHGIKTEVYSFESVYDAFQLAKKIGADVYEGPANGQKMKLIRE